MCNKSIRQCSVEGNAIVSLVLGDIVCNVLSFNKILCMTQIMVLEIVHPGFGWGSEAPSEPRRELLGTVSLGSVLSRGVRSLPGFLQETPR